MNPQVKEKWVNALTSGEYQQGNGKLRSTQGYCCLGVLCDLYAKENNVEWEYKGYEEDNCIHNPTDYWTLDCASEFLPLCVKQWAELDHLSPQVKVKVEVDEEPWECLEDLSELNDSGSSFAEIAKLIQENL